MLRLTAPVMKNQYLHLLMAQQQNPLYDDRSTRERHPPDYYQESAAIASNISREPANVKDVLVSPDKAQWLNAMEKEMESLKVNNVWDLVELPNNRTVVGSKWVFMQA